MGGGAGADDRGEEGGLRGHPVRIVLASRSPRRLDLLRGLGIEPVVAAADIDESPRDGERPEQTALRLARAKAAAVRLGACPPNRPGSVASSPGWGARPEVPAGSPRTLSAAAGLPPPGLVIGADTIVAIEGRSLGKPADEADARRMLAALSGRTHLVHTAVAVVDLGGGREAAEVATTEVELGALTAEEIDWYVATGEPMDKAGAYAIQGLMSLFVRAVRGSYSNVVGLPVDLLYRLARDLGHDLRRLDMAGEAWKR